MPLVGGNCNNGALCGPFAVNLNNAVSNTNDNIGAGLKSVITEQKPNAGRIPYHMVKINPNQDRTSRKKHERPIGNMIFKDNKT